ncbi:hypothetical protein DSO57_1026686 [Entomophthora muscae]|uniref:Uncharacterized protein n=1 Tax=Entomophthora muscae TaxID=34485 RepID=A0ACC2SEV7_9FUNG|nr:hypothetical protein DSO57_1026686 [Entomophthora muscae]
MMYFSLLALFTLFGTAHMEPTPGANPLEPMSIVSSGIRDGYDDERECRRNDCRNCRCCRYDFCRRFDRCRRL